MSASLLTTRPTGVTCHMSGSDQVYPQPLACTHFQFLALAIQVALTRHLISWCVLRKCCYSHSIPIVDSIQDKVAEVEIPQKHIEALERINAITIMDRLTYNVHKQSRNAEEVCDICLH